MAGFFVPGRKSAVAVGRSNGAALARAGDVIRCRVHRCRCAKHASFVTARFTLERQLMSARQAIDGCAKPLRMDRLSGSLLADLVPGAGTGECVLTTFFPQKENPPHGRVFLEAYVLLLSKRSRPAPG
jgi:hypothetical protein